MNPRKILPLVSLFSGLVGALAQGTIQFSVYPTGSQEVPPNSSLNGAAPGSLLLNGTTLSYNFGVIIGNGSPLLTDGTINGPAGVGVNAPMLFNLGAPTPYGGINPPLAGYFQGSIANLTGTQVSDLLAGHWYVSVFSDASFPNGQYRGQINLVPEPATLALLGLAGMMALVRWRMIDR